MSSTRRPNMRPGNFANTMRASAPNSLSRIRYMPDRSSIVTAAQAARLRTAEQRRILNDPQLSAVYSVWPNGGGLYHHAAYVHPNAFIGLCAIVDEHARIGKYALISGKAQVDGTCVHECCVDGNAVIEFGARIQDYARITGDAYILNGARIGGHVCVGGKSVLSQNVIVGGGFTICLTDEKFILEDFVYVLGSNITISKIKQIKALEEAMARQVR